MFLAATAILATTYLNPQDPVTKTNPPLQESLSQPQNLESLLLVAPVKLEKQTTTDTNYRAYVGQVKVTEGTQSAITEIISVVITDLDKINPRPTPDEICDLHNRASRTRKDNAGQLFKSERTTINDNPMVVLIGSLISRDANQNPINMYQTSAAFSTEAKAYEITWITLKGGTSLTNAIKSVRSASLQLEDKVIQPKLLVGTQGSYTFLGVPLKFVLPSPVEASVDTKTTLDESGRYVGKMTGQDWFATAEIAVRKSAVTDTSPKNLLKLLGYDAWLDLNPEFTTENGISVCAELAITDERHARIDIALRGTTICAVIVSASKDIPLPARDIVALTP